MANRLVNSHNEWDPLEEIIVGTARGANIPALETSLQSFFQPSEKERADAWVGPVPTRVIEETEEDIEGFTSVLTQLGVTVRRPAAYDHGKSICTPYWSTSGLNSLMPRDCMIVIGNDIIEGATTCRCRTFEQWAFRDLLLDYFKNGEGRWTAVPKPTLLDSVFSESNGLSMIDESEPLFDAANMFRCGKDIFFNRSNTGNAMGVAWIRRHLGETYRVHELPRLSDDHIGTTLIPLRPGKLLANPARVKVEKLPDMLRKWDIIWSPQLKPQTYGLDWARSSNWIAMNVLSVDEKRVIVEAQQSDLIGLLEKNGFEPIPVRYRHGRTFGGSFHCISLDVRRRGELQSYF
jgi:N-dimethylarginine dimethylaminohydrolase